MVANLSFMVCTLQLIDRPFAEIQWWRLTDIVAFDVAMQYMGMSGPWDYLKKL